MSKVTKNRVAAIRASVEFETTVISGSTVTLSEGGVDSDAIFDLIDSDYVAARAPASGGGGASTKTYVFEGLLNISTGTDRTYFSSATTLIKVDGFVQLAPTGNDASFTINKNGTEVATVSITDGQTSTLNNTVSVSLASGDYITVDIDSVGTTYAGSSLQLILTFS
jgi:hypothetical protein